MTIRQGSLIGGPMSPGKMHSEDSARIRSASEGLYRAIFHQQADGVFLADGEGRFIEVNPRFGEMLGYRPRELLSLSIHDLVPIPDLALDPIRLDELRSEGTLHKERRLRCRDGTLRRVELRAWMLPDGRYVALVHDMSMRRPMEHEPQLTGDLLQTTEDLQRVMTTVSDYLWSAEIDAAGNWKYVYHSPAVERVTGRPPAYYLEAPGRWLETVHPEDQPRVLGAGERLTSGQSTREDEEYRVVHTDGTVRWVRDSATVTQTGSRRRVDGVVSDITQRRQAEEAFRQANQRYETLVNAIDGIVWEADAETFEFSFVSKQAERLLGYPVERWINEPTFWSDHICPDDREWAVRYCQESTRDSVPHEFEYRMLAVDGRVVWLHDSVDVVVENGRATRVRGLMVDITERKQAEAQHEAHLWAAQSMDKVNRAMQGTTDLERMTGDVLDVVLSMFDCDRAWLCRPFEERPTWDSLVERTRPEYARDASGGGEFMEPRQVRNFEQIRAAGGPVVRRDLVRSQIATAIHPRVGEPWIFGLHQCSYAREWTQEEVRLFHEVGARLADALTSLLAYRDLRESERRLERAERMAHVGWWDRDYESERIYFSDEVYRMFFGAPPEEHEINLTEWKERWLTLIHPEDRAAVFEAGEAALQGADYEVEYRVVLPSGEERFVHSRGEASFDASGKPLHLFGTTQDITDRKLLQAKNEQLNAQFHQVQKMESIGRLAGGIAHDFNNLLVPIMGYIDLNLPETDDGDDPPGRLVQARRDDLVQVRRAAERAAKLTQQILAFSRQQVLQLHTLDLNEIVEGFKEMLQRLIGEDIRLETFLAPALNPVRVDKGQIEQLVMNLAVNARDAMINGGRLTIETANAVLDEAYVEKHTDGLAAGHYVMLAVSDTGQGMDATTQEHMFDPFFTTKEGGKGTGLGLATVFGIVKQHRGHIGVYSELEHGTTFKVYLPLATDATPAMMSTTIEPASVHGTETVLVVEDEEMVRDLVCETLATHGYDVLEADTPAHALELVSRKTVHLLLTDVIMPEMNGRVLYARLSTLQPECAVLYMSGYTRNVIVHHNIVDKGINFLPKPFTINALTRKVREVLDSRPQPAPAPAGADG